MTDRRGRDATAAGDKPSDRSPRSSGVSARAAATLGVAAVLVGSAAVHDLWVAPSARVLPPLLRPITFLGTGLLGAGFTLLVLATGATRATLVKVVVLGALLLGVACLGLAWRMSTEEEQGFLGSLIFLLGAPAGTSILGIAGLAWWVHGRAS